MRLVLPDGVDGDDLTRIAEGVTLARDLINTPANDMGPAELEAAARALAKQHGAKFRAIVGDDLLKQNFPLIHAVGRAADPARAPRLIDLRWGEPSDPKVTLVGKGVCFDTGGLDIKPESAMLIMKKDMGGAATVLALRAHDHGARAEGCAARADPGGRELDRGRRLPAARRLSARARASPSRSATPTPKAGWSSPMRWRSPTRKRPTC